MGETRKEYKKRYRQLKKAGPIEEVDFLAAAKKDKGGIAAKEKEMKEKEEAAKKKEQELKDPKAMAAKRAAEAKKKAEDKVKEEE